MSTGEPIVQKPNSHWRTLGSLWIVYGVLRLIMMIGLLIYGATATLMFGALLNRVPDPFALMDVFHFLYVILIALSAAAGLFGLVAGLALVGGMKSGRKLAIVAAVLSVSDIPLGITLGTCTLVELLPINTEAFYGRSGHVA
ncbi:MAG TPA: hypothetical protein VGI34_01370 [Candidatus Acidoferrales bacterium]|jgi:hypothetical protein